MDQSGTALAYTINDKAPEKICDRNTYTLVSMVAFLLGVPERFFEEDVQFKQEIFIQFSADIRTRIIRNLCILRTAIKRKYADICKKMQYEYKTLLSMPELVPQECIVTLMEDHINIHFNSASLNQTIIDLNRNIADRINNCKDLFPIWLKWEYLKNIFIMPNGLTESGIRESANIYYEYKKHYPYGMYLNWNPVDQGNILYNDEKFVGLLYQWNNDEFLDKSKVTDAGSYTKGSIYQFLEESQKTVFVVDCENSNPYKLCAVLQNLQPDMLDKVSKIILYDDIHTSSAWEILSEYIQVPIEHKQIDRIKQGKSLVDISLAAGTCKEFYQNQVDSFILVSSDSDYWALITAMPEVKFLVMIEHQKCSPAMKTALVSRGIFYCYIDDFYSGNVEGIKMKALLRETNKRIRQSLQINLLEMINRALLSARIELSEDEIHRVYQRYAASMKLELDKDGDILIKIKQHGK